MRELTTQELDLVAGGLNFDSNHTNISIYAKVVSKPYVKYNSAYAEAEAYGYNTFTDVQTKTTPYSSSSSAVSISA